MNELKVKKMFDQAHEFVRTAQNELARPEEDVVPYMIYRCTYKAINRYLAGYLQKHGIAATTSMPMNSLLKRCRAIDPKFNHLNLNPIMNHSDSEEVWTDLSVVREYMKLTTEAAELVA